MSGGLLASRSDFGSEARRFDSYPDSMSFYANSVAGENYFSPDIYQEHDFTQPGPAPMSLEEAAHKITIEYSEALEILGRI